MDGPRDPMNTTTAIRLQRQHWGEVHLSLKDWAWPVGGLGEGSGAPRDLQLICSPKAGRRPGSTSDLSLLLEVDQTTKPKELLFHIHPFTMERNKAKALQGRYLQAWMIQPRVKCYYCPRCPGMQASTHRHTHCNPAHLPH